MIPTVGFNMRKVSKGNVVIKVLSTDQLYAYMYIHTYIHAYIHTYIHTYVVHYRIVWSCDHVDSCK